MATQEDIRAYVESVLNNSTMTQEQKAAQIVAAASANGVTNDQIAASTGYTLQEVNSYLGTVPTYFAQNPDVAEAYAQDPNGMTPQQFAQTHYERYGANEGRAADPIEQMYQQYAGRGSDPEGYAYWSKQFGSSVDPQELQTFQNALFAARAQGTEPIAGGSDPINAMYQQVAGRDADPEGRAYWSAKFGPTIDAAELQTFTNAVAEGRANGTEPAAATGGLRADPQATLEANASKAGLSVDEYKGTISNYVSATLADKNLTQEQKVAKIAAAAAINGVSRSDIALATGIAESEVESAFNNLPRYFMENPDVAMEYATNSYGMSPQDYAKTHFDKFGKNEGRAAPVAGATAGGVDTASAREVVSQLFSGIGRTGIGAAPNQVNQDGFDYWVNELTSGRLTLDNVREAFGNAVTDYLAKNPNDPISKYVNTYQAINSNPALSTGTKKLGDSLDSYLKQFKTAFDYDSKGDARGGQEYARLYGELSAKGLSDAEIAAVLSSASNNQVATQDVVNFGQKYTINQLNTKLGDQTKTISGLSGQIGDLQGVIEKLRNGQQSTATNGQVQTTNSSTANNNSNSDAQLMQNVGNYLYYGNYQGGTPAGGVSYITDGSSSTTGATNVQGWGLNNIGLGNYGSRTRRAADGSNRDIFFTPKKYNRNNQQTINGAGWGASYMPF